MSPNETLYERLGGQDAIDAVVEEFYDRALADEELAPYFEGVDTDELREHQKEFVAFAADGPVDYDGRGMAAAHAHLDVTDDAFDRVAEHLDASLRAFDVAEADREELLTAVEALRSDVVTA